MALSFPEFAGVVDAWGYTAADTPNADPVNMNRTSSYLVIIMRTPNGYAAASPSFPDIYAEGRGARVAYARLKAQIKASLLRTIADDRPVPRDAVVQTRTLRVDLWYLRQQEELQ